MTIKITIGRQLLFFMAVSFFSSQALANCADTCESVRSSCLQTSSQQKNTACEEQFNICNLSCNRDNTLHCVYLGFKNYEGDANKENELQELTGGFARVTGGDKPHFGGLCSSHGMKCEYSISWDKTMYTCGGGKREPRRVACCR
ncbi:MAG: hypothetical protein OQK72_11485 [Gammaproteobacteria bacterium]|nr:hypothetical protein [Gammaproteobacteria bacterium]